MSNQLTLQILDGTTPLWDISGNLLHGGGLWYENGYSTGSLAGGISIPRDPRRWWEVKGTLRVVIKDERGTVYEGIIPSLKDRFSTTSLGTQINFIGMFGWYMLGREIWKRWADNRVDEQTWEYQPSGGSLVADKCIVRRDQRLYFLPKAEAWINSQYVAVRYELKGIGDIARVIYDYRLLEGAQSWEISLWRSTDGSSWTQMTAASGETYNTGTTTVINSDATGSIDVEPASSPTFLEFRYYARAGQTPTSNGAFYASITELFVYTEDEGSDGIRINSVAQDLITTFSGVFNSDTSYLNATNFRKVEPFITSGDRPESLADVMFGIAGFGDTNDDRFAVGVKFSDAASSPNGKPVLYTANWPSTDDHDYFVSVDDPDIASKISVTEDFEAVRNYIYVTFTDERGWTQTIGPDDYAALTDSTSVADYGQRDYGIRIGNATEADAAAYGARYLAEWKDPQTLVNGTITVMGSIDGVGGDKIPFTRVEHGKILRINEYSANYVISKVRVDYDARTAAISLGPPKIDPLFTQSVFATVYNDPVPVYNDPVPSVTGDSTDTGTGTGGNQPWWKILDKFGKKQIKKWKAQGVWSGPGGKKAKYMAEYRELRRRRGK